MVSGISAPMATSARPKNASEAPLSLTQRSTQTESVKLNTDTQANDSRNVLRGSGTEESETGIEVYRHMIGDTATRGAQHRASCEQRPHSSTESDNARESGLRKTTKH